MVQKFGDTNIIRKLSKYISICAYKSLDFEIMPQIKPYLVNKDPQNGSRIFPVPVLPSQKK